MIVLLALGCVLLGGLGVSLLVVPMWREDRERMDRRVNDLLALLEAKAAPAEFAAYVNPVDEDPPEGNWIFSDDGLIAVEVTDG